MEFQVKYLALFLLFFSNGSFGWFCMGNLHKNILWYWKFTRFILGPTLSLLYISDLSDDVICNVANYADDTTLYSKCDHESDVWQQLELASELESDLRDTN